MKKNIHLVENEGLPSAIETEKLVIGACLGDSASFETAHYAIEADCFTVEAHRWMWQAMSELHASESDIGLTQVVQWLSDRKKLESVGGIGAVAEFAGTPRLVLDSHIRLLQEKATLRKTIVALSNAMNRCMEPGNESAEVLSYAADLLEKITKAAPGKNTLVSVGSVIEEIGIQEFCQPSRLYSNVVPLPAEWQRMRGFLPFFRPGQLIVLAAFTSQGKSAMALHLALDASKRGYPVAMFSMEMDKLEISHRAASHLSDVDSYIHQNCQMKPEERLRYQAATTQLADLPLFIDDRTGSSVPAIFAAVAKMKPKPKLVIVDYLQIMEAAGRADTRAAAVAEISRGLKRLAMQFQVPVLALSQFNRDASKQGRKPELHDLRESGSIEQDANIAILLSAKKGQEHQPLMDIDVEVAKNRGGRKGVVSMVFMKPYSKFEENPV